MTNIQKEAEISLLKYLFPILIKLIKRNLFSVIYEYARNFKNKIFYKISILIIFLILFLLCIVLPAKTYQLPDIYHLPKTSMHTELKSYSEFINDVGYIESRNNWSAENKYGMLGRFQFSPVTLRGIGFNVEKEYFLADTLLQLTAFKRLLRINEKIYKKYINDWCGKMLPQDNKCIITKSGILMAFHLKPAGALQYFNSGCIDDNNTDAFGTPVSKYIKIFSGYNID